MANGRWRQKFTGDDLDLFVANEAGQSVRALAKQHGISKSVVAARIARVRKRLNGDPWIDEPKRRRPAGDRAGKHLPAAQQQEVIPPVQRPYSYCDWLDDRDFAAGRITAEELGRRRAPRPIRFIRL